MCVGAKSGDFSAVVGRSEALKNLTIYDGITAAGYSRFSSLVRLNLMPLLVIFTYHTVGMGH